MGSPKARVIPPPQMRGPVRSARAGSCITRAPQPALWFARFCQGAGHMSPGPRGLSREGYRGVTTMITGGARLAGGAGTRTGEAARTDGTRMTGGGKPRAGTVVTITGVRGSMLTGGVRRMVAGGTNPDGKTVKKLGGATMPGCTDTPKPALKKKALRAAALVAHSMTTANPTARIRPFRMSLSFFGGLPAPEGTPSFL